jgi:4-hydroxy-4-methyl-2-oxoglutarate aldolase
MTEGVADPEVERLRALDTCAISDALDALGLDGVITGITPRWEGARAAGRAVTMQLAEGKAPEDQPKVHLGVRAILAASPGDVIVVGNDGRVDMGSWGGLLSVAASQRGVAGVITDGACRDVDEAREMRFPVFARASAARTARGRIHEQSCNEPVRIGSLTVHSGDLVLADGTAVVVLPAAQASSVLDQAEEIAARESAMAHEIRSGANLLDVLGIRYEDMLAPTTGGRGV